MCSCSSRGKVANLAAQVKLQSEASSAVRSITFKKAGSNCSELPLKTTEAGEEETQEVAASLAAANKISIWMLR